MLKEAFDIIQYPFLILKNQQMKKNFFNLIKGIYRKPITNILNGETSNYFSLISGTMQGYLFTPLLSKHVLQVLDSAIKQEKHPYW